jgi:hypothetical protein
VSDEPVDPDEEPEDDDDGSITLDVQNGTIGSTNDFPSE